MSLYNIEMLIMLHLKIIYVNCDTKKLCSDEKYVMKFPWQLKVKIELE